MIALFLCAALATLTAHAQVQPAPTTPPAGAAVEDTLVELNSATLEQLTTLPGIGPKRAAAIVARRDQQPFTRVTQLMEVRGIGKKTLQRLAPHLRVVAARPQAK